MRATRPIAVLAATAAIVATSVATAQETEPEPSSWHRRGWSYGAGVGAAWGPFATDSGPWLDAFAVLEAPLSTSFYFRAEPGLTSGWTSDSDHYYYAQDTRVDIEETFHAYGVMVRALLGYDFTNWATLRLGGVGGYLRGTLESNVCPSESYARAQYGLLAQVGVRIQRFEVAIQGESLSDFANPRCRPNQGTSLFGEADSAIVPSHGALAFLGSRISYVWY